MPIRRIARTVRSIAAARLVRVADAAPWLLALAKRARVHAFVRALVMPPKVVPVVPALISVGPHNLRLYEYSLVRLVAEGCRFVTSAEIYGSPPLDPTVPHVLIRHDVDYTPERLDDMLDVEMALGIRSDVHVPIGDRLYDTAPWIEGWRRRAAQGFLFGLHTLAPGQDDFFSVLRDEIELFEKRLGFPPCTFSIHGISPHPDDWVARRAHFLKRIDARLKSFGFIGSHNLSGIDTWVEDSGWGGEFSYLTSAWLHATPKPGGVLGLLAHPDHWVKWPPRWKFDATLEREHPTVLDFIRTGRATEAKLRGISGGAFEI